MANFYDYSGNIFEFKGDMIVNTVNCVGAMGAGIARQYRDRYPAMYDRYQWLCRNGLFDVGMLWIYNAYDYRVLNFPTKLDWKNDSKIEYIEAGLIKLVVKYKEYGITSICFPPLGCGKGNLKWSDVKPLIIKHLQNTDMDVYLISPP